MRGKNLVNLLEAVELLSKPEGATISELMDRLGVVRRSVYNLIQTLETLGFPVYDDKSSLEREKRWKLEETYLKKLPNISVPEIKLNLSEILALHMIKGEARIYRGTEIEKKIESAFVKLSAFLPENAIKKLSRIKRIFIPTEKLAKDYSGKEELIDQLTDAMIQQTTCYVQYHSFDRDDIVNFAIDPLYFFENQGGLYIYVQTTTFKDIRMLAVERIKTLTQTDKQFDYPKDFDPEKKLSEAFNIITDDPITAKIWFSADQAKYVKERKIAQDYNIEDQPDGSIILDIKTSGAWELKRWVLGFGADAEIIEPKRLRKEMAAELADCLRRYKI